MVASSEDAYSLLQVPPGHIWLEGDNLIVSRDSREYGPVPLALVRGRAMVQVGTQDTGFRVQQNLMQLSGSNPLGLRLQMCMIT
jgi:hypothetical protein